MESFLQTVAPIAIALFGFIALWGIVKLISDRKDPVGDTKERPADGTD